MNHVFDRNHCRNNPAYPLAIRSGRQNRKEAEKMPRMRTATGALEIIKQQDPGTAVTLHYIRQLISSGKVPFVPVGRKKLINVDELLAYLERKEEIA